MATSLSEILYALQNGVVAIQKLTIQLRDSFPSITDPSSIAPAIGTVTFTSSQVSAFGLVTTSSGTSYRIALYPSS